MFVLLLLDAAQLLGEAAWGRRVLAFAFAQGQITKAGSTHARRLLVEAAHHYRHRPTVGKPLAARQAGQDPRVIAVAWRAQRRLHQRWAHLRNERGKPSGTVAVACARELAAFCWEAAILN